MKITCNRVDARNVGPREIVFGYFLGPFGALITNAVFTSFLNRFYTDMLGMVGSFLTVLPLLSTVFVVAGNMIMGIVIDRTKTRMGKARPYLLLSAPLVAAACIAMFAVPMGNETVKIVWVAVTYNLYFAVAYPMYFMAHSMMVPLSTRDTAKRGKLSIASNVANMAAAGFFAAILFPMMIYPNLKNRNLWLLCMCILGGIAVAGILLEFAFTRERITEECGRIQTEERKIPIGIQLKGVVTDKYWWIIILFYLLFGFSGGLKNLSMSYYCDYVVGTFQDGRTQTILAAVSGAPMALGIALVWPMAKKIGKKNLTVAGLLLSVAGGAISLMAPENFWLVVTGVTIKSLGTVPACYVMMALFADVLDHLEAKNGFRCDGLSMSLYSIITVSALGIITAVFNGLISLTGYQAPVLTNGIMAAVNQNAETRGIFILCFLGIETIAYAILSIALMFLKVEKNLEEEQRIIRERHNAV